MKTLLLALMMVISGLALGQANRPLCTGLVFSTEQHFLARANIPYDDNPIISDGDLISRPNFPGPGARVCARNRDLLAVFRPEVDFGLDAADVIDAEKFLIAFSTEISNNRGRFSDGDVVATNGAVIPNQALTFLFNLPKGLDVGLDTLKFVGKKDDIVRVLEFARSQGRAAFLANPSLLVQILKRYSVDILFSTEESAPTTKKPAFLDGDLLSARTGTIVASNAALYNPLPAGIPTKGVDYGLDALTVYSTTGSPITGFSSDARGQRVIFSSEISSLDKNRPFTDGDILTLGGVVVAKNFDLIKEFEPVVKEVGLDTLGFTRGLQDCKKAEITKVGGIQTSLINSSGYALKLQSWTTPAFPPTAWNSPFGSQVSIRGNVPGPDCVDITKYEYRVEFQQSGGAWTDMAVPAGWQYQTAPCLLPSFSPITSGGGGWIDLATYWDARTCSPDHALNVWSSTGLEDAYKIRLAVRQKGTSSVVYSPEVPVYLDNTAPAPVTLSLYDENGKPLANQCDIQGQPSGTKIIIKGQAKDKHFGSYQLYWTGGEVHYFAGIPISPGEVPKPDPRYRFYDGGRPDLGSTGTTVNPAPLGILDLTAEYTTITGHAPEKCGYAIELVATDRAILGGFNPTLDYIADNVGPHSTAYIQSFCFTPAG